MICAYYMEKLSFPRTKTPCAVRSFDIAYSFGEDEEYGDDSSSLANAFGFAGA